MGIMRVNRASLHTCFLWKANFLLHSSFFFFSRYYRSLLSIFLREIFKVIYLKGEKCYCTESLNLNTLESLEERGNFGQLWYLTP